jgi:hypothetical protein
MNPAFVTVAPLLEFFTSWRFLANSKTLKAVQRLPDESYISAEVISGER